MAEESGTNYKSIASFISLARGNSFANASKYWFSIIQPPSGLGLTVDAIKSLSYKCHKVTVPDSEIEVEDVWFPQIKESIAKGRKFGDITCSFYCTDGMPEIQFFEKWFDLIYAINYGRVAYKNTYEGKAELEQLDRNGNKKAVWTFDGLFPTKIGSLNMAYESRNTILTFDVTFTYRLWNIKPVSANSSDV